MPDTPNPTLPDRQRSIFRKCDLGRLASRDDSSLMEWGWSEWTPVIEKLLERIEALEATRKGVKDVE